MKRRIGFQKTGRKNKRQKLEKHEVAICLLSVVVTLKSERLIIIVMAYHAVRIVELQTSAFYVYIILTEMAKNTVKNTEGIYHILNLKTKDILKVCYPSALIVT